MKLTALSITLFSLYFSIVVIAQTFNEENIRQVRQDSNTAFRDRNIDALKLTWVPELHVTGSNGQVVSSGSEMSRIFSTVFKNPEFITYVRSPEIIHLSPGKSHASEAGHWTSHWSKEDGEMKISGTYLAQWHKRNDNWLIRSEVFIAHDCEGSSACADLP